MELRGWPPPLPLFLPPLSSPANVWYKSWKDLQNTQFKSKYVSLVPRDYEDMHAESYSLVFDALVCEISPQNIKIQSHRKSCSCGSFV